RRLDMPAQLVGDVVAAFLLREAAAERRQPRLGDLARLVEDRFLEARQAGLDQGDRFRPERRDPQQLPALGRDFGAGLYGGARRGERDDLDRRYHLSRLNDRVFRQRAERYRFVHQVEPIEPRAVEDQEAARLGVEIGAAGKRVGGTD